VFVGKESVIEATATTEGWHDQRITVMETKVELKHLLEDIRDGYGFPVQQAIITELVANALDSEASDIGFIVDAQRKLLTVIDNGLGMTKAQHERYHDIAATTKVRGKGIGFAGLGAKLALLICNSVVTETRTTDYYGATNWYLRDAYTAPWNPVRPAGRVQTPQGTSVTLNLRDSGDELLDEAYIRDCLKEDWYPLFDEEFKKVLRAIYPRGVQFAVDGKIVVAWPGKNEERHYFGVRLAKKSKPIGVGFLCRSDNELREEEQGVAVSTYGKVIKRGWDWLGLRPRRPEFLNGIVEVPDLVTFLQTNKADFLKGGPGYDKYLQYRKSVQQAVLEELRTLGEEPSTSGRKDTLLGDVETTIDRILKTIVPDFPELDSLLTRKRPADRTDVVIPDPMQPPIGSPISGVDVVTGTKGGAGHGSGIEAGPGPFVGEHLDPASDPKHGGSPHTARRRSGGLRVTWDNQPDRPDIGWFYESTVFVNEGHAAWVRASKLSRDVQQVYMLTVTAWVLARELPEERAAIELVTRFWTAWGNGT
jgi:hypothetical protein